MRLSCATLVSASFLFLAGCASTRLNNNTVEISAHIDDVYTRETLNNLSKFIDDPNSIPSQVILSAGTFQTTDSLQPSITFPFTSQIANTFTSAPTGITQTKTGTMAGSGAGLQATLQQQQSYTTAPLSDANALRNQQALYRNAVYGTPIRGNYFPPRIFFKNKFFYDPFFLQLPHCVICNVDQTEGFSGTNPKTVVNKRLVPHWLRWDSSASQESELINLGRFGNHDLYIGKTDYADGVLTNFVLFTLSYSNPAEVFSSPPSPPAPLVVQIEGLPAGGIPINPAPKETPRKGQTQRAPVRGPSAPTVSAPSTNEQRQPSERGPAILVVPGTLQ